MRFLIDRCAGRRIAHWLLSQGHDAVHVADLGEDPGDAVLLRLAADQQRILITIDADFGTLIFRDAASNCGIVRLPDVPPNDRIAIMKQIIEKHSQDLLAGLIITVKGTRIRITKPPPSLPKTKE